MFKALFPLFVVVVIVIAGCVVFQKAEAADTLDEEEIAVLLSEPNTVDWKYPITAKVWYPGEVLDEEESFLYYTIRCWPGCHDPNSQPRPAKY